MNSIISELYFNIFNKKNREESSVTQRIPTLATWRMVLNLLWWEGIWKDKDGGE